MNEALMSGLPVFMTNISPNNAILPEGWLIKSWSLGTFRTKVRVELFEADVKTLANTIDNYFINEDKDMHKQNAFNIGYKNFAPENLKDSYLNIISHI
jgi:hypothetical protein